jgi:predicted RNA-binding protein with PIN domain
VALSPEVEGRLARALGAYIRTAPVREVPARLKRWRSLRPQALTARSSEVVAALDDENLRSKVLEWLDGKHSLPEKEASLLRVACERPEGWEKDIDGASSRPTRKKGAADDTSELRARVDRERARASSAREEARRVKEETRAVLQAEKKRSTDLARDLAEAKRELEQARGAIKRLEADNARTAEKSDREVRRERRSADKARAEIEGVKEQLRTARREVTDLARKLRDAERRLDNANRSGRKPSRSTEKPAPPKRKVLKAPPGLLDDAPETLRRWLDTPGVHLLIDGYNVTKAERGFGDAELAAQRDRLVQETARLVRKHGATATIVFDGSDVAPGTKRRHRQAVKIEYSKPDEIADDHLIARLAELPATPVIVVTNDRELQQRAAAARATVATSNQFLELLR